jgi:hypothetical protein
MAFQHLAVSVHMELSICPHPRFLAEPQHLEIWGWIKTYQNPYFIQLYNVIQTLDNVRQCHVVIGYTVTPYSGLTSTHTGHTESYFSYFDVHPAIRGALSPEAARGLGHFDVANGNGPGGFVAPMESDQEVGCTKFCSRTSHYRGVSENSVPLKPNG